MITKIRIKNFGSIKDEQLIKFNKDVTTFIGKNESGKSTILKAIDKLNGDKILESEKNVLLRNSDSYIEGTFTIEKDKIIKESQEITEETRRQKIRQQKYEQRAKPIEFIRSNIFSEPKIKSVEEAYVLIFPLI